MFQVNGRMVAERTVIAQAIPPSGTLWLGCHPRLQPPGVPQGKVELYLFRMWADLNSHGFCEDGTVIGWDSQFWSVTSSKAKEKDPYLLCGESCFRLLCMFRNVLFPLKHRAACVPYVSQHAPLSAVNDLSLKPVNLRDQTLEEVTQTSC